MSLPNPLNQAKTDPRTEAIMWIGISCPLLYAVAKQGFELSTGSAALLSVAWGGALWGMQTNMIASAWKLVNAATQTKLPPPAFTVYHDKLNQ